MRKSSSTKPTKLTSASSKSSARTTTSGVTPASSAQVADHKTIKTGTNKKKSSEDSPAPAPTSGQIGSSGQMFYIIYGKFIDDKADGVYLAGVHFGGLGGDTKAAEAIARDCVNSVKGGSIIPKIFPVTAPHGLVTTMEDATEKFQRLEAQMAAAEEILNRPSKRK